MAELSARSLFASAAAISSILVVLYGDFALRVACRQSRCHILIGNHPIAWRYQIRLYDVVVARRTLRAVARNRVVGRGVGAVRLHCSDSDHVRIVTGSGDGAIAVCVRSVVAALVASRNHHHYSCVPGRLNRLTERIQPIALVYLAAKRKIDYADVVRALERDSLPDGGNDPAIRTRTVPIQHAQDDQIDVRRHTLECPCAIGAGRARPGTAGDSGYGGSMAVQVSGSGSVADEVLQVNGSVLPTCIFEVVVVLDPAVNDRDSDTASVEPVDVPRNRGVHRSRHVVQ